MILIQTMIGTSTVILEEEGWQGVWMVIMFARVSLDFYMQYRIDDVCKGATCLICNMQLMFAKIYQDV